jgi:hypothetical protein
MIIPNLMLIAGTGNKSGKTTFACRVINQFRHLGINAIKITPHFHETTPGLELLDENPGFSVYKETNPDTDKDTSRMLQAGAAAVYFAKVTDEKLLQAFESILKNIKPGIPVVCEAPALRYQADPGMFVIMKSEKSNNNKDINKLLRLPHVMFQLNDLKGIKSLPIDFRDGKWLTARPSG